MNNPLSILSAASTCAPGEYRSKVVMGSYERVPADFNVQSLVGKEIQYGRSKPQERTYIIVGTHPLHDQIMYVISSVVGCANPQCHRPNCPVVKAMVNVNAVYNRIVKDIKPRTFSNAMNKLVMLCPHYVPMNKARSLHTLYLPHVQVAQKLAVVVAQEYPLVVAQEYPLVVAEPVYEID